MVNKTLLPKIDDKIHLTDYGYSVSKSDISRHKALNAACKNNDILTILRRLNLIRNYQSNNEIKVIFSKDVDYLKSKYRRLRLAKKYKNQNGGVSDIEIDAEIEDNINTETSYTTYSDDDYDDYDDINTETPYNTYSDDDYDDNPKIHEVHTIDDSVLIFRTLKYKDIKNSFFSDNLIDANTTKNDIIIGIEKNKILQGYCIIFSESNIYEIKEFDAVKSFRSILYNFIEKFALRSGILRILSSVKLFKNKNDKAIIDLNFWYSVGFLSYNIKNDQLIILLEKFL